MFLTRVAANQGVHIHYLDSIDSSDQQLTPIVICPGLSETAEEYEDLLSYLMPRRAIALSFRGRGRSDTPGYSYDLTDHVGDLEAVIKEAGIERFHLYGNSRGVSYALGFAQSHEYMLQTLILQDYPSEHKRMPVEWAEDYMNDYIIPAGRNIRQQAVKGIQRDSTQQALHGKLEIPVLVIRGLLEDSLITESDCEQYKQNCSHLKILEFAQSGHDIRHTEREALYREIQLFLNHNDQH